MGVYFETKEKAEGFMNDMIKVCKENNKNYDYDVDYINIQMTYQEYMASIRGEE